MTVSATPTDPSFAARIDGVDIARPIDDATWATVRAALDEHSVLVFRRRHPLDDEQQVAFSRRFGARGHAQHEPGGRRPSRASRTSISRPAT